MIKQSAECCPEFHPEKWDEKTTIWERQQFIKASVPAFFHIPFSWMIGSRITKMYELAKDADAIPDDWLDAIVLFNDPHTFRSDIYMLVTKEVPGAENVTLSGTFISKVFDGPYNAAPKFMKKLNVYITSLGKEVEDYYVHYAYCPKCMEKFGHNYQAWFAKV